MNSATIWLFLVHHFVDFEFITPATGSFSVAVVAETRGYCSVHIQFDVLLTVAVPCVENKTLCWLSVSSVDVLLNGEGMHSFPSWQGS